MPKIPFQKSVIRCFILGNIDQHPQDITRVTANHFKLSRQAAVAHLRSLIRDGLVEAEGSTKDRAYRLRNIVEKTLSFDVTNTLEEDVVWRNYVRPLLGDDIPQNVLDICQYGLTEMVNNVREHSESPDMDVMIRRNAIDVVLYIIDHGVGIFNKIQKDFGLNDPRHALLELSKGKLTSDASAHTGEGIFFTSRMFDVFQILSGTLFFSRKPRDNGWLVEVEDRDFTTGTIICMRISINTQQTLQHIFDQFANEQQDYSFTRTHVPVKLAKYPSEQLVSRSQARRVLARFEKFDEVMLDFDDVATVGPAFVDEIFRVYKLEHPSTTIIPFNMTEEVARMVRHTEKK